MYGYNNIEIPVHVSSSLNYAAYPDPNLVKNLVSEQLVALGFHEIWSNSLVKASVYDTMKDFGPEQTVRLFNPLSSDLNGMRQTLFFGGLECIIHNLNRKNSDLKFFEFGNCYFFKGSHLRENPAENYSEEEHLALFLTGNNEISNWVTAGNPVSFYLLKSYVENILKRLGFDPDQMHYTQSDSELLSAGLKVESGRKILAEFGIISPGLLKKNDLDIQVFYADFNWSTVLQELKKNKVRFRELPKYPEVRRDLALVLDKSVEFSTVKEVAIKTERHLLKGMNLFDVYEGKGIPDGKKSYAVSFILRDDHKTMNDKLIDKTMERLLQALENELGAKLRG
jgi:phenylalanyl-tRNA synthetase beta chain